MNHAVQLSELELRFAWETQEVDTVADLNRVAAADLVARLRDAIAANRRLIAIVPVGPLDYSYWAEALNREQLDGASLVTVNMDEYLDDDGRLVPLDHPLSFRRFMNESLFDRLEGKARMPEENRIFPDPDNPAAVTRLLEEHGADVCYAGIGLSGHLAFNDPPAAHEACDDGAVSESVTRALELSEITRAQICLAGADGMWEIVPRRAVTVGMSEILASRQIYFALLRTWHAGLWRQAFFGPVTGRFPASFVQQHRHVRVTATRVAAAAPALHASLRV